MNAYFVEQHEIVKLTDIANRLRGGADNARAEGYELWLLLNAINLRGTVEIREIMIELARKPTMQELRRASNITGEQS